MSHYKILQTLTKLINGTLITITPHITLNTVQCVIFSTDLKHRKDEEVLDNLKDQKVTEVCRFANSEIIPTIFFLLRIASTRVSFVICLGPLQVNPPYILSQTHALP